LPSFAPTDRDADRRNSGDQAILSRSGFSIDDIDTFEVNEAFAPVVLAWQHDVGADPAKVTPAEAPSRSPRAWIRAAADSFGTMVNTLEQTGGRIGLQVMCEGGGCRTRPHRTDLAGWVSRSRRIGSHIAA